MAALEHETVSSLQWLVVRPAFWDACALKGQLIIFILFHAQNVLKHPSDFLLEADSSNVNVFFTQTFIWMDLWLVE